MHPSTPRRALSSIHQPSRSDQIDSQGLSMIRSNRPALKAHGMKAHGVTLRTVYARTRNYVPCPVSTNPHDKIKSISALKAHGKKAHGVTLRTVYKRTRSYSPKEECSKAHGITPCMKAHGIAPCMNPHGIILQQCTHCEWRRVQTHAVIF